MFAKLSSMGVIGIDAYPVEVEVHLSRALQPTVTIVGLPDTATKESRERVKAAIKNSKYDFPHKSVTVNLAPANTRKEGPAFDLPIALAILLATKQIEAATQQDWAVVGELALDGAVRPVKGSLSSALACKQAKIKNLLVPAANAAEAAVVDGISVYPVNQLSEAVGFITGQNSTPATRPELAGLFERESRYEADFTDVKGQESAKRALVIAAAGGHNVLMIGPPGSGKTMLAKRLPTILPSLLPQESIETTRIHSVTGLVPPNQALITTRPFRSPHHTISDVALVGGGSWPQPGEISLAHKGVLFLDELPEFNRRALEVLRQPLEDGRVRISRAKSTVQFPCEFMLICAMNPCPCGYYTDPLRECHCTPYQVQRYIAKISGPLLDRIDIHIEVPAVRYKELRSERRGVPSGELRRRVVTARVTQAKRFAKERIGTNSRMSSRMVRKYCRLDDNAESLLEQAMKELGLSARAHDRILKVARTVADLDTPEGETPPEPLAAEHIAEAVQYRTLDRDIWGT